MGIVDALELPWALMSVVSKALVAVFGMLLIACGGSKASDGTTGKQSAIEAFGGLTPPDVPWGQMSYADREFYMIGKVNPIMKEIFERYDIEEYSGFDCVDCHGEEMKRIKFKMPPPSMYVVPPEGTPGHRGMMLTFPETVQFMEETVTPAMGKLLGVDDFTCAGCHPTAPPKRKNKAALKPRPSGKGRAD